MSDQLPPPEFLLSILCQGRNVSNMESFAWRLSTVLNKHAENIVILGLEQQVEILVCDWGSGSPIYTSLELTENARAIVKFLIVPPDVTTLYDVENGYSAPHAINAIARRACGKYILIVDSGVFVPLETMSKLIYYLKLGFFHSFNLRNSFFWASKYIIPNDFTASLPYREYLEEHIQQYSKSFGQEPISIDKFSGGGVCLLISRQMWFESTGCDEQLINKDSIDTDITKRLLLKYRWDDLINHGMKFYYIEHSLDCLSPHLAADDSKMSNPQKEPITFTPNPPNWGLADYKLPSLDGYGLAVNTSLNNSISGQHIHFDQRGPLRTVQDIISANPRYKDIVRRFVFEPHSFFCNEEAIKVLLYVLQPETVCEIGSWMGASARCFATYPSVKQVVCIDHWDRNRVEKYKPGVHPEHMMNNMYEQFLANAVHSDTDNIICPLRLDSDSAAAYCVSVNQNFDLIYIDGDHTTVGARADILRWYPLLGAGGYICGDDWTWQKEPDNVSGAVLSVAREKGLQVFFHGNFWMMIPGEFSIKPLTSEVLREIKPIKKNHRDNQAVTYNRPLVSIFCTCKNAEATIRRHILAVIVALQHYDNIEYIVQDGVSTDSTLSIFEEFREVFGDKLKLISEPDSCCEEGFWRALSRCQGEIICASLADEEILPDAIPFIIEQFRNNPEIDVIHGDIYNTDIEGNIYCRNPSRNFDLVNFIAYPNIHLAASFFRRSAFVKAGLLPYPGKYGLITDDFNIWVYLGLYANIKYIPVVFAKYAIHINAISIRPDLTSTNIANRLSFIENFLSNDSLPLTVIEKRNFILAKFYAVSIFRLTNANLETEAQKYRDALARLTSSAKFTDEEQYSILNITSDLKL